MNRQVGASIARGVQYLSAIQSAEGSFGSFSSPVQHPFKAQRAHQTTFAPALILNALGKIPEARTVRGPLARWLLAQKSEAWSFNYWATAAPERTRLLYPD